MANCKGCDKPFPIEFENQVAWMEIHPSVGGSGHQICCICAMQVFAYLSQILEREKEFERKYS